MARIVLFVCQHGAGRSRVAAACFSLIAPAGWAAFSAGVEPQTTLGDSAAKMLSGTAAAAFLDADPPRPIEQVVAPNRIFAIDCIVPGAEHWVLTHQEFGAPMFEELYERVAALARELDRA